MNISIGKSRKDMRWKVADYSWEKLCERLAETTRTAETVSEYKAMSKDDKSALKDIGGFVGGTIVGGRRLRANVTSRSLITLDADFAKADLWDNLLAAFEDCAFCIYSTHSHTPESPRLRIIIPLNREVTPEEYEPLARLAASDIGIEQFDITTYDPSRLMYWPSTPKDGEYVFKTHEGGLLWTDAMLDRYTDWHDTTEWPLGPSEQSVKLKAAKAQGEPTEKPGMVGLFCRAFDVPAAIDTFLSEESTPCSVENRYTYTKGSTSAGLVLYQDGKFAYSHHSTDPAGGQLCNAFDLVRLHKFGDLDKGKAPDTPITKLPSYEAMCKFAGADPVVKQHIVSEGLAEAQKVFAEEEMPELQWTSKLKVTSQGVIESTINNVVIIMDNDPNITGAFALNQFTNRPVTVKNLPWKKCEDAVNGSPWTDIDDSGLRHYIETTYGISNQSKIADALNTVLSRHSIHPVRKYLTSLKWDGVKRAETLFVNYLGAEDTPYTRTVTRKWMTAAVARILRPGVKFDNLVVLVGAQGIGKSLLGKKLGGNWFSDTFTTVQGKEAYEQLHGAWIVEIGELSAMKKAEVEAVKMFISKQEDSYRAAYGHFTQVYRRQCVFYGTTNDDVFLRDYTGNRRFWPIGCDKDEALFDVFDLTQADIDQLWAEAVNWYDQGESLYLDAEMTKEAIKEQERYRALDPRLGRIDEYLETRLPKNWDDLDRTQRRNFIQGYMDVPEADLTEMRTRVTIPELAYELFGIEDLLPWQAKEYHQLLSSLPNWKKTGERRHHKYYGTQYIYEKTGKSMRE